MNSWGAAIEQEKKNRRIRAKWEADRAAEQMEGNYADRWEAEHRGGPDGYNGYNNGGYYDGYYDTRAYREYRQPYGPDDYDERYVQGKTVTFASDYSGSRPGSRAGSRYGTPTARSARSRRYSRDFDLDDIPMDGLQISKRTTQLVEQPVSVRKVKVPVTRQVEVPVNVQKVVRRPSYKERVDYVDTEKVRNRVVWMKKVVPEKYVERKVVRRMEPSEEVAVVNVPSKVSMNVRGYREHDQVENEVIEVEDLEDYEVRPLGSSRRVRSIGRTYDVEGRGMQRAYSQRSLGGRRHSRSSLYDATASSYYKSTQADIDREYYERRRRGKHRRRSSHGSSSSLYRGGPQHVSQSSNTAARYATTYNHAYQDHGLNTSRYY